MTVYYSTLITENIYGSNENVSITDEQSNLNSFLGGVGQEKLIISSLNISSNCTSQVNEPLLIERVDPNGNSFIKAEVPQLDSYQANLHINNYKVNNLYFDQNTKFAYNIQPNCSVRITLNISDYLSCALSEPVKLMKAIGEKINSFIYGKCFSSTGLKEKEEVVIKKPYPTLFKEKEESPLTIPALYTEERKALLTDINSVLESPNITDEVRPFVEKELNELKSIVANVKDDKNLTNEEKADQLTKDIKKAQETVKKAKKKAATVKKKITEKKKEIKKIEPSLLIGIATAGIMFTYVYLVTRKRK